jgi:flagellar biosynthetic protein FlhB
MLSLCLVLLVAFDVPFQLFQHNKKLKMTLQEVKDEFKDSEGKPEVKSKIRRTQYEMSQRRMMEAVPQADVVITNPTHYAVALKYDPATMAAPVLVAKGADLMAEKIRLIARERGVLILEAPPLARSLYYHTKVNREIPEGLYVAVAQVLAYVFQLKNYRRGQGPDPGRAPQVDVPEDLRHDD